MTMEEVETKEEITHVLDGRRSVSRMMDRLSTSSADITGLESPLASPRSPTVLPGGFCAKHEAVATEELTTSSCEERQRFVIKTVRDPRNDRQLTLQASETIHAVTVTLFCLLSAPSCRGNIKFIRQFISRNRQTA